MSIENVFSRWWVWDDGASITKCDLVCLFYVTSSHDTAKAGLGLINRKQFLGRGRVRFFFVVNFLFYLDETFSRSQSETVLPGSFQQWVIKPLVNPSWGSVTLAGLELMAALLSQPLECQVCKPVPPCPS